MKIGILALGIMIAQLFAGVSVYSAVASPTKLYDASKMQVRINQQQ